MKKTFAQFGFSALALLACLGVAPTAARANISFTFSDVNFSVASWSSTGTVYTPVASLSGSFTTNDAITTVISSNLEITADSGESKYAFTVAGIDDAYLPHTIGIYNAGWSSYIDLYLTSPLTSTGSSYSFSGGYDCPGCAVLDGGAGLSEGLGGNQLVTGSLVVTPEPAFYALVTLGLTGLLFAVWQRRRASGIA